MPVNGVLLLFSLYITISKVSHHRYRFVQLSVYIYIYYMIYVYHRAIDAYLPPHFDHQKPNAREWMILIIILSLLIVNSHTMYVCFFFFDMDINLPLARKWS